MISAGLTPSATHNGIPRCRHAKKTDIHGPFFLLEILRKKRPADTAFLCVIFAALCLSGCSRRQRESLPTGFPEKRFVERCNGAFDSDSGAALAMETGTGRIILLIGESAAKKPYTLGSLFKPVTLAAALAEGAIDARHEEFCGGRARMGSTTLNCWRADGHGNLAPASALANSCNIFFARVGATTGAPAIVKYARMFGFGEPSGLGLEDESAGELPDGVTPDQTHALAIGELGSFTATPLQTLVYVGAIATRGTVFNLHTDRSPPNIRRRLKVGDALDTVILGMHQSVLYGTSSAVSAVTPAAAGKTGTAVQPGEWRPHGWFAGFYPVDDPEIALVVFMRRGEGGSAAAPVAARIMKEYIILTK